ncbi:MAG: class IIb bacteriocin, lactobin A/cerein 7B family [Erysipelotrichaceae bacterium]|nr:class IIb bacteriocin, lactobin A/cerein 7B family [Erysipelotrichaceae bacterium]
MSETKELKEQELEQVDGGMIIFVNQKVVVLLPGDVFL